MRLAASDLGLTPLSSGTAQTPSTRLGAWSDALVAASLPAPTSSSVAAKPNTDSVTLSPEGQAQSQNQPDAQHQQVLELLNRMFGITQVQSMDLKIATSESSGARHSLSTSNDGQTQTYAESYRAFDQSSLTASGTITLQDGRTLKLNLQYQRTVAFASDQTWQGSPQGNNVNSDPAGGTLGNSQGNGSNPVPAWAGGPQGNSVPSWLTNYQTTGVSSTPAAPATPDPTAGTSFLKQLQELLRQLNQPDGSPAVNLVA
jgi:hypothetical protein